MKPLKVAGIAVLMLLGCLYTAVRSDAQTTNVETIQAAKPKVTGLTEGHLELDVVIKVDIDHLAEWAATPGNNPAKLVPFLSGLAINGNYPIEIHTTENHLRFHLQITPENKDVWIDLLGDPEGIRKPVIFSVGLEGQSQFDTVFDQKNMIPLTVISPWYGVVALIIVLVTLFLLAWLARTSNIIREPGPKPPGKKHRPYNLGRTQMAFWFFLVYSSYVVIWLITAALDTITASLLGLMGISAGTALSEAMIDSGKDTATAGQRQDLTAEKRALEQSIPEVQSQAASLNAEATMPAEDLSNRDSLNKQLLDYRTRLAQINQQIEAISSSASSGVSAGFLRDILADGSGYSFHRFQIFAWTIVLGVIFVSSVYNSLSMPEFSTTLLGLMGISSGTYIGFKFPEQK
ncbi:MAG: hypothetical protein AABO41_22610 [Acidobacteriota bacterium]